MNNTTKCFEFSGNELIRICLGLERRFVKLQHLLKHDCSDKLQALELVVQIIQYADRYDLRNKFVRFYRLAKKYLHALINHPQVDAALLTKHIERFDAHELQLYQQSSVLPEAMLHNVFLSQLKIQSKKSDIGTLDLLSPFLQGWLVKEHMGCVKDLKQFYTDFDWLNTNVYEVLCFLRDNSIWLNAATVDGYYHYELGQGLQQIYMISISLDNDAIIPIVSVDQRRFFLKFNKLCLDSTTAAGQNTLNTSVDFKVNVGAL